MREESRRVPRIGGIRLVPILKPAGAPKYNMDDVLYAVSYLHLFDENRYLRAKIAERGREDSCLLYTELEDLSAEALGDVRKLVFITDERMNPIYRYFKHNDSYHVEREYSHELKSLFPKTGDIEESKFERLIRDFTEEFFFVFHQDPKLKEYLNSWLVPFRDDFNILDESYSRSLEKIKSKF